MTRNNLPKPGHAQGHVRNRFEERLEEVHNLDDAELRRAAGQLWNCTDIMPGDVCDELDMPRGSTYAQAARRLRRKPIVIRA